MAMVTKDWRFKCIVILIVLAVAYKVGFRIIRVPREPNIIANVVALETSGVIRIKDVGHSERYRGGNEDFYKADHMMPKDVDGDGFSSEKKRNLVSELLSSNSVTNIVHYVWCERKIFEFQHYLSLLSVVKYIVPERIIFHYAHYPRHDTQFYNTWFEDFKKEFPFMYIEDIKPAVCTNATVTENYIRKLLDEQGGVYVHANTVFQSFPIEYRMWPITDALTANIEGFLVVRQGAHSQNQPVNRYTCSALDHFNTSSVCTVKKGPYYPRYSWHATDDFSRHVRYLMYGTRILPTSLPSNDTLVPMIGHMLWLGGGKMDFIFYLSCLSQVHILRVQALYIHGDRHPTGPYWDEINGMQQVKFIKRSFPNLVYRNTVRNVAHMSDVFRLDTMSRYGGIYTDVDAVWVNPIPHRLRTYDAVASYDWPQMYSNFPDYINLGVILGKSGAPYWLAALESMKLFKDDFYGYNGLLRSYKMYERRPDLVHIDDHLQVMCWELKCHPTWYKNFRDPQSNHLGMPSFNWRDALAFHWTYPSPKELENIEVLKNSTGIFAEIGQRILKAAGKM